MSDQPEAPPGARLIPLSRGLYAIVDEDDYEELSKYRWYALSRGYVVRKKKRENGQQDAIRMHRFLLGAGPDEVVDHRNGNPLDNRRANLRRCTQQQNSQNKTSSKNQKAGRFKGVCWDKCKKRWVAAIRVPSPSGGVGKPTHLGRFASAEEAARAYDAAALRYHGEFAALNFPREE